MYFCLGTQINMIAYFIQISSLFLKPWLLFCKLHQQWLADVFITSSQAAFCKGGRQQRSLNNKLPNLSLMSLTAYRIQFCIITAKIWSALQTWWLSTMCWIQSLSAFLKHMINLYVFWGVMLGVSGPINSTRLVELGAANKDMIITYRGLKETMGESASVSNIHLRK